MYSNSVSPLLLGSVIHSSVVFFNLATHRKRLGTHYSPENNLLRKGEIRLTCILTTYSPSP